jgi:hypothetical protein
LMLFNNDPGVRAEMHLGEAAAAHLHSQPG